MKKLKPFKPPYSRTRTSGGYSSTQCRIQHNNPGTSDGDTTWGTGAVKGWMKVMTDVVTPDYTALRKKLLWINNPVSVNQLYVSEHFGTHITNSVPWTSGGVTGPTVLTLTGDAMSLCIEPLVRSDADRDSLFEVAYPDVVSTTFARNKATVDCLNRIAPPSAQSLVSIAELHKSIEMIAGRARKIADVIQAVKRGDVRKLKHLLGEPPKRYAKYPKTVVLWDDHLDTVHINKSGKTRRKWMHTPLNKTRLDRLSEASKLWLEFRYGWSPLVHDIVDEMKAFDAVMRRKDHLETSGSPITTDGRAVFKAKALEKLSGTVSSNITANPALGEASRGRQTYRRDIEQKVECHAYAHYCHSVSGFLSRFNDFGAFDVPRAIWELCPWSFVIDWFIPIGDWLGALTPKVGVEILASGVVVHDLKSVTRTVTGWIPGSTGAGSWPSSYVTIGTSDSASRIRWSRTPGLPLPSHPIAEVNLNLKRLVDAAALLKRMR